MLAVVGFAVSLTAGTTLADSPSGGDSEPLKLASASTSLQDEETSQGAFALETNVFLAGEKQPKDQKPILKSTTLFYNGRAYDMVDRQPRVVRFDFRNQLATLLDQDRKVRTQLRFDQIARFQAELTAKAQAREGLAHFLASPQFIQEFDATSSRLKFSSPWVTYTVQGSVADSEQVEAFAAYADWSAQLASMLAPTAPPAAARLAVNDGIRKRNWRVHRVTRSGGPRAKLLGEAYSQHTYRDALSAHERKVIQQLERDMGEFRSVSFMEFRQLDKPAQRVSQN